MKTWKLIFEFPTHLINEQGEVKNRKSNRIITPCINSKGYYYYSVYKNGKKTNRLLHRLIGQYYISNQKNHPIINHIDNNPKNNELSNLEWCTYSHNLLHKRKFNNSKWLKKETILKIREYLKQGIKNIRISELLEISIQRISDIKTGRCYSNII